VLPRCYRRARRNLRAALGELHDRRPHRRPPLRQSHTGTCKNGNTFTISKIRGLRNGMGEDMDDPKRRRVVLMDPRPVTRSESKSRLAARALSNAGVERRSLQCGGPGAPVHLEDAQRLEAVAAALMKPSGTPTVKCGEVTFVPGDSGPSREITDTLRNPDQAAIDASVARTDLLLSVPGDIVPLAIDAATSANARNSIEKMLTHQMAVIHKLIMRDGARALEIDQRAGDGELKQSDAAELSRLSQAISRLSSAFQGGMLTLQRQRNGGSQTVTVRHVTVEAGAQAIIGNVKGGGGRTDNPGRGKRK
jgi:hypothetical protein